MSGFVKKGFDENVRWNRRMYESYVAAICSEGTFPTSESIPRRVCTETLLSWR